jgi:hypothetical protein
MNNIISFVAGGNIAPSRFVVIDTSADRQVTQAAGTTAGIIGVSQMGTRRTPYSTLDDGYAAVATEEIQVFCTGSEPLLELGGTVAAGDSLTSDGSGKGITTTTDKNNYGAIALEAGVSGGLCRVRVQPYVQLSV